MIFNSMVSKMTPPPPPLSASITPKSGITYEMLPHSIEPDVLSTYAFAISRNSEITNETTICYIDDDINDKHYSIGTGSAYGVTFAVDGTSRTFSIAGLNHDTLTDATAYGKATATGKAGITFEMRYGFSGYMMNTLNTSSGSWGASEMRVNTMPLMLAKLPTSWQEAIKYVNKQTTSAGYGTDMLTTSDNLFLLSHTEVFGGNIGEGTQYSYYRQGYDKYKIVGNGWNFWWLRSPYNTIAFYDVNSSGSSTYNNASYTSGCSFGFCI